MRNHSKLLLAGLTAAVVLATAVGTASARRLVIDEANFRVSWRSLVFSGGLAPIRCPVTLEGSFHTRTIEKVIGTLLGFITRAALNNAACSGGSHTILTTNLPWHVTYEGFTGTLPDIREIHILLIGLELRLEQLGASCLLRTTAARPAEFWITLIREAGGILKTREIIPNSAKKIPCTGSINIEGSFTQEGTSTVTRLNASTAILVRLI